MYEGSEWNIYTKACINPNDTTYFIFSPSRWDHTMGAAGTFPTHDHPPVPLYYSRQTSDTDTRLKGSPHSVQATSSDQGMLYGLIEGPIKPLSVVISILC